MNVQEYAIKVVTDGAESHIEDDLNEDGEIDNEDLDEALALAYAIVEAIRANPETVLALIPEPEGALL